MYRNIFISLFALTLTIPSFAQGTRAVGLGGDLAEFDEDANEHAAEKAAQVRYDQHSVERLPIDEQPLPSKDDKNYLNFLLQRVKIFHARGQYPQACADFDLIAQAGYDLMQKKDMAGRSYLACAQKLAEQKDVKKAQHRLEQAKNLIGTVPEMNRCLGSLARLRSETALAKGDIDSAMAEFDQALKLEPDVTDKIKFSAKLTYLARKANQEGDVATTLKAMNAAINYFPDNVEARKLQRQIWFRDNLAKMIGGGVLVLLLLFGIFISMRKISAGKFARIDPDLLPDPDDDDDDDSLDDDDI